MSVAPKSNAGSVQGKVLYAFANKKRESVGSGGLRTGAVLKLTLPFCEAHSHMDGSGIRLRSFLSG